MQVALSLAWLRWWHSHVPRQQVDQRGVVVAVGVRRHLIVELLSVRAVSYTHLTLPTICSV
eukprot:9450107-Alexandrium_andersonii.AAC.1